MPNSKVLVFTPPKDPRSENLVSNALVNISGWLHNQGYSFDQRSFHVEKCLDSARGSEYSGSELTNRKALREYFQDGSCPRVEEEAAEIAEEIESEGYGTVVAAVNAVPVYSRGYMRVLTSLAIFEKLDSQITTVIAGKCRFEGLEKWIMARQEPDYLIQRDFEGSLGNVIDHEMDGKDLRSCEGLYYSRNGENLGEGVYKSSFDNRAPPFFDCNLMEMQSELTALGIEVFRYKLGRGCNDPPDFSHSREEQVSYKPVSKVISELLQMQEEFGMDYVKFSDLYALNRSEYMLKLAEEIRNSKLDIRWGFRAQPRALGEEYYRKLYQAGCRAVHFEIASFSDSLLKKMGVTRQSDNIEKAIEQVYRADINPFGYFRVGHPEETFREYLETESKILENEYLMGAAVRKTEPLADSRQKLGSERMGSGVPEGRNPLERMLDCSLDRGRESSSLTPSEKQERLQRIADKHLFLKNYGRAHPVAFVRKMLDKLRYGDYPDITYSFVERSQKFP